MERCNDCAPLEAAYLSALETYSATQNAESVLYRNGDSSGAREYEPQVHKAGNVLMDAKGELDDHREQHRIERQTQTLRLGEIGRYTSSDGNTFITTYQVTGLQEGNHCVVGLAGEGRWRVDWHVFKDNIPERIPMPDTLYESPRSALEAVRSRLTIERSA